MKKYRAKRIKTANPAIVARGAKLRRLTKHAWTDISLSWGDVTTVGGLFGHSLKDALKWRYGERPHTYTGTAGRYSTES